MIDGRSVVTRMDSSSGKRQVVIHRHGAGRLVIFRALGHKTTGGVTVELDRDPRELNWADYEPAGSTQAIFSALQGSFPVQNGPHQPGARTLPSESSPALIIEFAHIAETHGWKPATLQGFCSASGISPADMRERWPGGIRSVAWQLNAHADAVMIARATVLGSSTLSGLILGRFADNEALKGAVGSLARSDAMHPFDTLARTAQTARAMWQCLGISKPRRGGGGWVRVWALTIMYSVFVLVWLADRSKSQRAVRSAVHFGVRALGEH